MLWRKTLDQTLSEKLKNWFFVRLHHVGRRILWRGVGVSIFLLSAQAMTEAAFFTIGQSRTIGNGKIRPLADYRSRSRLFILSPKISNLYLICRFIHLQKLKKLLEVRIGMKYEVCACFFQEKISFLILDFSFF